MKVDIGAAAALFPEKEYISGIFIAVLICLEFKKTYSFSDKFEQNSDNVCKNLNREVRNCERSGFPRKYK
jgi:hypothetical protein